MSLVDFVPYWVSFDSGSPQVKWCYAGSRRFTDGFFDDTITAMLRHPFASTFPWTTPIEALADMEPGLRPSGFVFHMSRCGSTLISRLLATSPRVLVMSEPGPLDAVIRGGDAQIPRSQRAEWIRWMVRALGRPRHGESHYVIKLDCWHMLDWDLLQEAFPDTPWIFVYRDPLEVLASIERRPSYWSLPGVLDATRFGLTDAEARGLIGPRYVGTVLDAILAKAEECAAPGALVNYTELPGAVWQSIAARFGIVLNEEERSRMQAESTQDSKNPVLGFTEDSASKRERVSELARAVCGEALQKRHDNLEALRGRQARPPTSRENPS
ncbi:MAG: hypothetical protein JNL98_31605 [Bryobacterales bacterium]|nr:hypothetical protein [Bryobacterales bacterium]